MYTIYDGSDSCPWRKWDIVCSNKSDFQNLDLDHPAIPINNKALVLGEDKYYWKSEFKGWIATGTDEGAIATGTDEGAIATATMYDTGEKNLDSWCYEAYVPNSEVDWIPVSLFNDSADYVEIIFSLENNELVAKFSKPSDGWDKVDYTLSNSINMTKNFMEKYGDSMFGVAFGKFGGDGSVIPKNLVCVSLNIDDGEGGAFKVDQPLRVGFFSTHPFMG